MALPPEQQAVQMIKAASHILVITHAQADVDAIASVCGLGLLLKAVGKTYTLVVPEPAFASIPSFLPHATQIKSDAGCLRSLHVLIDANDVPVSELTYQVQEKTLDIEVIPKHGQWSKEHVSFKYSKDRYDLVIAIGCTERAIINSINPSLTEFLYRVPVLNIGYGTNHALWGNANIVEPMAISTTEVLASIQRELAPNAIDEELATCFLAGLIAKTQSFRTGHVSPRSLELSSRLIDAGARHEQIVHALWRNRSLASLKLWGRMLTRLRQDTNIGLAWTAITDSDLLETGASLKDIDAIIDEIVASISNLRAAIILISTQGTLEARIYAFGNISAVDLARPHGGDGSNKQARIPLKPSLPIQEAMEQSISMVKQVLPK